MIPLIGEMSAKQTKGCPNSENFAPAAGFAVNYGTGTDRSLRTKNNASVGGDDSAPRCRGGFPRPPVDFDVICPSVTRFARATR